MLPQSHEWYNVFEVATSQGVFWLALLLIVSTVSIKDVLIVFLNRQFSKDFENINTLTYLEFEANYMATAVDNNNDRKRDNGTGNSDPNGSESFEIIEVTQMNERGGV